MKNDNKSFSWVKRQKKRMKSLNKEGSRICSVASYADDQANNANEFYLIPNEEEEIVSEAVDKFQPKRNVNEKLYSTNGEKISNITDSSKKKKKKDYSCPICDMTFKLQGLYNKHLVTHSDLRPYKCQTCHKAFKYNFGLKKHVKEQHSESAPLHSCKICDFNTKHYPYLQEHFIRRHTSDYKYKCHFCGKQFKVEPDYKVHMTDHETGPQVCDICGISYPNKSSLYYHRNYKHTEKTKSFECKICKKRLHTEKNLEVHLQQHEQTYVCEECGMSFARKYGLTKHRRVHTGEKSHLCPVCGKAFACMATQRVHFLTHAGVRPYICDVCGLNFTQRSSLMLHWKKRHPDAYAPPPPVTLKNILETIKSNFD